MRHHDESRKDEFRYEMVMRKEESKDRTISCVVERPGSASTASLSARDLNLCRNAMVMNHSIE